MVLPQVCFLLFSDKAFIINCCKTRWFQKASTNNFKQFSCILFWMWCAILLAIQLFCASWQSSGQKNACFLKNKWFSKCSDGRFEILDMLAIDFIDLRQTDKPTCTLTYVFFSNEFGRWEEGSVFSILEDLLLCYLKSRNKATDIVKRCVKWIFESIDNSTGFVI